MGLLPDHIFFGTQIRAFIVLLPLLNFKRIKDMEHIFFLLVLAVLLGIISPELSGKSPQL